MTTIYLKELRDLARWVPLAILFTTVMVWNSIPGSVSDATQFGYSLQFPVAMSAAVIAIAFGILQSVFDTRSDARGYLLHRPIAIAQIYWAKVLAAATAYAISLAIPLFGAAIYAEVKGIERLPMNAWQIIPSLLACGFIFFLHPSAIWTICRDAKWVGTKTIPAIGVAGALFAISTLAWQRHYGGGQFANVVIVAIGICLLPTYWAAKHAFCNETYLLPGPNRPNATWPKLWGILASSLVVVIVGLSFILASIPNTPQDHSRRAVVMDRSGDWWDVIKTHSYLDWNLVRITRRPAGSSDDYKSIDRADFVKAPSVQLIDQTYGRYGAGQFQWLGQISTDEFENATLNTVGHHGKILIYGSRGYLKRIVTPDSDPDATPAEIVTSDSSFGNVSINTRYSKPLGTYLSAVANLIVSDAGVFQLDASELTVRRLLDDSPERFGILLPSDGNPAMFLTHSGNQFRAYDIVPLDDQTTIKDAFDPVVTKTYSVVLPAFRLQLRSESTLPSPDKYETITISRNPDGELATTRSLMLRDGSQLNSYGMLSDATLQQTKIPQDSQGFDGASRFAWSIPPVAVAAMLPIAYFVAPALPGAGVIWAFFLIALAQSIISAAIVSTLTKRRHLTKKETVIWTFLAAILGFGTILAVVAIYRKPVTDNCTRCHKQTPVAFRNCTHCGSEWESPQKEGIEIFDRVEQEQVAEVVT